MKELTPKQKEKQSKELVKLFTKLNAQYRVRQTVTYLSGDGSYVFELKVGNTFRIFYGRSFVRHIMDVIDDNFTKPLIYKIILV